MIKYILKPLDFVSEVFSQSCEFFFYKTFLLHEEEKEP